MAPSPAFSWPTLTAYESAITWPPLASLARAYYASQARLVRAADYLALAPATAAEPFIGNAAARELVAASLPAAGPSDETYAQYAARASASAQPLLHYLTQLLQDRGIALATFTQALTDQGEASYLPSLLDASFWMPVVAAWQQQMQHQLDVAGRGERLLDAQGAMPTAIVVAGCYTRLLAALPEASLESLQAMPLNELAGALWSPRPGNDDAALTQLVHLVQGAAQQVVAANYPDEELTDRLLARLDPNLPELAQTLVLPKFGQTAVTTVTELAQVSAADMVSRLAGLPANHAFVYALATWFQQTLQAFLLMDAPAPLVVPAPFAVRGQLLGVADAPLAAFALRLRQVRSSVSGSEFPLGMIYTGPDGYFSFNVPHDLYLTGEDTVAEAPSSVRAAVYRPGQDLAGEPVLSLLLEPAADQSTAFLRTDLPAVAQEGAPASVALVSLAGEVPAALTQLLADNNIASLAELRAAGGIQGLAADHFPDDSTTLLAAQRLDGLAQFEVVSGDTALHEQVVAQGFYSPAQLLDTASQAEFVARLTAADPTNVTIAGQASAFYQQAAAVRALSQTLGLLAATQPAPPQAPAPASADSVQFISAASAISQQAVIVATDGSTSPVGGAATQSFAPVTTADEASTAALTGYTVVEGLNPSVADQTLAFQPDGQCDCPACRSAVSPTAYLAALLKYATQNLRDTSLTPPNPSPKNLQDKFLQPFCDLGVSCQSADEQVCQYRLAIEVIQAYWRSAVGGTLTLSAARPYVEGILEALLQALGTSLAEVRALTTVTRPDLASRLAVPEALLTLLQARFGTAQLQDGRSLDEVEADLAEVFGLASTATDPLRTGQLMSPNTGAVQLVRWSLQGVSYGRNTNVDGQLHFEITPAVGSTPPHLTVYTGLESDQHVLLPGERAEDNVVARGTLRNVSTDPSSTTYSALLYPQHGSELRGSVVVTIAAGAALTTFSIAVVPRMTAARQQVLSASWLSQDASAIDLLQAHSQPSWNGFTFLVDPDLLGPDDFRPLASRLSPTLGNRAYELWRRRYEFLQDQLALNLQSASNPGEGVTFGAGPYYGSYGYLGINSSLLYPFAAADALAAVGAVGGLGALLDALTTHSLTYPSDGALYVRIPWRTGALMTYQNYYQLTAFAGTEVLTCLHTDCGGADTAATLATQLLASLGLSVEAMQRLYELWQLNRTQALDRADLQEALDIVRQSVKKRFEADWTAEEQSSTNPVEVNTLLFQSALHEPQAGIWDRVYTDDFGLKASALPRIDPDEVSPLDLPDFSYNDSANALWSARQAELLQKRQAILASGTAATTAQLRADDMLRYAYQANRFATFPAAVLPGTPPTGLTAFEDVVSAAQSSAAALTYLTSTLALRPDEVTRLAELRTQVRTQPADTLWQEMAALLTLGWKRAVAYRQEYVAESTAAPQGSAVPATTRSWLTQEADVPNLINTSLDYLMGTRKHRLVKWRAEAATRARWVDVLALAGQRPLLDPDQLVPGDFRQAGERSRTSYSPYLAPENKPFINPAFDLYQQRVALADGWLTELQNSWSSVQAAGSASKVQAYTLFNSELYTEGDELETLYAQQHAGVDVSARLRRLQLTPDGLELLVSQANSLGADRAAEVPHLLVQVRRQRQYAAWAREEVARHLVPTPYYFRQPQTEAESLVTTPWRGSAVARRQWQRSLTARFEQASALSAAQQQSVKAAEDLYLPLLRDALLVAKVGASTDSLATRATFMENKYLLDFQTACCQHTTRVAQALEVLQKLFQQVRGGLASNGLLLSLDDKTFESDWQWLSSYERWRSLMFLYLYPQNVLLPALKPGQTSQLRQTVSAIRQATSLTPVAAGSYMDDYQTFLADMSSLVVATATQTMLTAAITDGFQATAATMVSLQVALSATRVGYANLYYVGTTATESSYSWTRIPGTALIERIVGSAAYQPVTQERYVYVFALLREDQKNVLSTQASLYLAFQRFNLRTLNWDDDYTRLTLNGTGTPESLSIQVAAGADETWPPIITGLRNRISPLYTDAPLSLPVYNTAFSTYLSDVIGRIYNVDLFYATLAAQGDSLIEEQTKTFFLVSDLTLLACTRASESILFYTVAIQVGEHNATQANCLVIDVTRTSKSSYLISSLLSTFLDSTPQQNPGGIGYNTPVFTTGLLVAPFNDFRTRLRLLVNGSVASFQLYTDLVRPQPNSSSNYPYNTPLQLATNTATVTALGARLEFASVTVDNSYSSPLATYQQGMALYYTVGGTQAYALRLFFSATTYQGSVDVTSWAGSASSQVLNSPIDAITTQPEVYSFVGPFQRSGTGVAQAAITPYVVLGHSTATAASTTILDGNTTRTLCQSLPALPPLFSSLSSTDQDTRRQQLVTVNASYALGTPGFVSNLVNEAYYALPMLLAQELMRGRNYDLALHYFRLVYDYTRLSSTATPDAGRLVYPTLASAATASYTSDNVQAWLQNPNNPYTLAALRANAHLEYVVMSVVRCLLAYADNEFTTDSTESVARARTYYELAARLLQQDIAPAVVPGTAELLDPLDALFPAAWLAEWQSLKGVLARVNQRPVLEQVLYRATVDGSSGRGLSWLFDQAQRGNKTWAGAFDQAWQLVNGQLDALPGGYLSLCATTGSPALATTPTISNLPVGSVRPYVPFLDNTAFCIPTNPVPFALALQAELNLFKIRSCRNIAGTQRELDPYAAATDNTTGLPTLSSTGQLVRSGRLVVPSTPFRYAYIIERARNLVALAQQTEASLLSALEKRDAEAYNLLKARQDIATSQATVQLQSLRVTEAEDGVDLAGLQLERSQIMESQYDDWLSAGLNSYEVAQLNAIVIATEAKVVAALASGTNIFGEIASGGGDAVKAAASAVAAVADSVAQISGLEASYERRADEWKFQRNLAAQDIKIGQQQIKISNDQLKVVGQEKRIAQLQLDHASAVLNFLTTKFTNAELYDWMSGILENAYSYFLQQATATARLAEQQLAFERQEVPAGIVQEDYYSAPADDLTSASLVSDPTGSAATDRKGLTGSVRLLQDLTRLDEYAFETTRRKLQLTKTISLAQSFPTEFVRFRDTGTLAFACQPEWFDQDFPGQYLRVLRRVRTSVIALVPPVDGIKARLSTAGTSHVTVNGTPFQTLALPRAPEVVALTAPSNATGLFELDQQSTELLYPFEGLGVDVPWTFSMQPASNPNLDYSAVADVLISLDYSAMESADYARQVVQQLGTDRRQVVALSLRDRFADQWYDLHHADEVAPADRYVARLTLTADDLPRNLRQASLSQVSLFVDAPLDEDTAAPGAFTDRSHLELRLTRGANAGGAAFTNQYGLISTRTGTGAGPLYTGNAAALVPLLGGAPTGDWVLSIAPGRLRDRLAAGLVNDIYLILEVEGNVPAYVL